MRENISIERQVFIMKYLIILLALALVACGENEKTKHIIRIVEPIDQYDYQCPTYVWVRTRWVRYERISNRYCRRYDGDCGRIKWVCH